MISDPLCGHRCAADATTEQLSNELVTGGHRRPNTAESHHPRRHRPRKCQPFRGVCLKPSYTAQQRLPSLHPRHPAMSSATFWSEKCQQAVDRPLQAQLNSAHASCGVTVRCAPVAAAPHHDMPFALRFRHRPVCDALLCRLPRTV
jgi:hypothetical protein